MAGMPRFLMVWPLLLAAVLPMLYSNFFPLLNQYGGRVAILNPGSQYQEHAPKNNGKCKVLEEAKACEDVRIHHESNTAFLACGHPETRIHFYPAVGRMDQTSAKTYQEYFLKYDLEHDKLTTLKVVGWDGDLILHGIEILKGTNTGTIHLFAVNHARKGESILRFSHVLGSDVLTFEREFTHSLIRSPNAVMPDTLDSFFASNDHQFYPSTLFGLARKLEDSLGPFNWATGVVHCTSTGSSAKTECKHVSPPHSHPHANGILLLDQGRTLMVNDVFNGSTTIYDVDAKTKMLKKRLKVYLGAAPDNLSLIPGTEDIAVCVFPSIIGTITKLHGTNPLNPSVIAPSTVLRLVKARNYEPEVLYWDDGALVSVMTGAALAVDPRDGGKGKGMRMVAGGVFEGRSVVCDLD